MANSIIKIHQSLHGYQNGHQLIASSLNLNLAAKRTLLYQSDLTGSLENGFDSYVTGYPIIESNLYVLARTWYAPEMERPGCVWTHSLILEYSDLGKFIDLVFLNEYFVRPNSSDFNKYSNEITINPSNLETPLANDSLSYKALLTAVYNNPDNTIIIPTNNSLTHESELLRLWSDQWPRLRRGFKFCSGALGLKSLDDGEFDVQIVPERNVNSIARQSSNPIIVKIGGIEVEDWTLIFEHYSKEDIRKFLWTFGADMEGRRANYIPLMRMFEAINSKKFELAEVNYYINEYFPDIDKGKFLKKNLYGSNSILPVSEKELVQYLVSNGESSMINFEELQVLERIVLLVNNKELSVEEVGHLFIQLYKYSLDESFWRKFEFSADILFELLKSNSNLASIIIQTWPYIIEDRRIWTLEYSLQKLFLKYIQIDKVDIFEILKNVLVAKSRVIFDFRDFLGSKVSFYTLDLLNGGKGENIAEDWIEYIVKHDTAFEEWFWQNKRLRQRPIYVLIFRYYTSYQLGQLGLDAKEIIGAFESVRNGATRDFINITACKILALGFSTSTKSNYLLVETGFSHVYQEVNANKLNENIWNYISKEHQIRDYTNFFNPFAVLAYFQKSKRSDFNVEPWDVARSLIVKTVNQYLKNSWPLYSFVATFSRKKEFKEAILYCCTFEDGIQLIERIITKSDEDRIKLNREQLDVLKKMLA